jgi:PAS domain S-box-containing protein
MSGPSLRTSPKGAEASDVAQLRGFLEVAPDAMVIVDPEGRIRLVNAQTERLFGYVRGKRVERLLPERFGKTHSSQRDAYVAHPKGAAHGRRPRPDRAPPDGG